MTVFPPPLGPPRRLVRSLVIAACLLPLGAAAAEPIVETFQRDIQPVLKKYCYDCHGDGIDKGGVTLDAFKDAAALRDHPLWLRVLKNVRSGIMPPAEENHPLPPADAEKISAWIKRQAFGLDPTKPDPGRITVRRLNRTEYRNTIRDLVGVDFDAEHALAADDIGYGFDTIGDLLTLSPMRMEKFLEAAQAIVAKGVPTDSRALTEQIAVGQDFLTADGTKNGEPMSFYQERRVAHRFRASAAGDYRVVLTAMVDGRTNPDPGRCKITVTSDGREFFSQEYAWHDCQFYFDERVLRWEPGEHEIAFHLQPLEPPNRQRDKMDYKILTVRVLGPLDRQDWLPPTNYARFFPRDRPPVEPAARRAYAREVLSTFATKAYRRPVGAATLDRLVALAESIYQTPDTTFEVGLGRAFVAILASPRFLFRVEEAEPAAPGEPFAHVDNYALASRLSYFLWSTLPDDELLRHAAAGTLRPHLRAQVRRMLADPKSAALVENFTGQWLQSRELGHLSLDRPLILAREGITLPPPSRRNPVRTEVTAEQRAAMQREAEAYFAHVVREDRSVLELIDSDYAFLNATLAAYYGLPAETAPGAEFRRVALPADDPRGGGVLTMAATLAVTSNPTRTSPVKRGKWILENILGAPAPPPPPDIPSLEDTEKKISGRTPTQREVLALHREAPLCASCHARMDPLGLALENFNALGLHRTQEFGQPIDAAGELFTGESFKNIRDLKRILVTGHREEIYRTLTEKLLIYALGRGLEYYDVPTVDAIVARLAAHEGKFSELLLGVIESAPFQQRRAAADSPSPSLPPSVSPSLPPSVSPSLTAAPPAPAPR